MRESEGRIGSSGRWFEMAYVVEFAPDGRHFHSIKRGSVDKIWNYFVSDWDIRGHIAVNPFARFRMKNEDTGKIIGVLPRKEERLGKVI